MRGSFRRVLIFFYVLQSTPTVSDDVTQLLTGILHSARAETAFDCKLIVIPSLLLPFVQDSVRLTERYTTITGYKENL